MSVERFFDTNIIIYLFDHTAPDKQAQAQMLITQALQQNNGCISHQVVQETLNVILRKLNFATEDASRLLNRVLIPLWQIRPAPDLYHHSISIQDRYQFSFYDALIIAAALEAGCKKLYSEDLQHGQRIERLRILNPFY